MTIDPSVTSRIATEALRLFFEFRDVHAYDEPNARAAAILETVASESDENTCDGCGMPDPCGRHYNDCRLLEPGDLLVDRATGDDLRVYEGPDLMQQHYDRLLEAGKGQPA